MPPKLRPRRSKGKDAVAQRAMPPPLVPPRRGKGKARDALAHSPFRRLDKEIRTDIWLYVLYDPKMERSGNHRLRINEGQRLMPPAITRTCRELREETLLIWLTGNDFEICLPLGEDSRLDPYGEHSGRMVVLAEFIQGAVEWLNRFPKGWHRQVGRMFLNIQGEPGVLDSDQDRRVRLARFTQLARALQACDYLSPEARAHLRLVIEGEFHETDEHGNCTDKFTDSGHLLHTVGLKEENGHWACRLCHGRSRLRELNYTSSE